MVLRDRESEKARHSLTSIAYDRESTSASVRTIVPKALLIGVVALTVASTGLGLLWSVIHGKFLNPYNAVQYYITYDHGFVRRGLPGTIVRVTLGRDPSSGELVAITAVVTGLGLCALIRLLSAAVRHRSYLGAEGVAFAVLVSSPLTVSMVIHNRSRFDPIVVACICLLAVLPRRIWSKRWLSTLVAAALVVIAVGTLEFSIAFIAPVLLARSFCQMQGSVWRRLLWVAAEATPGAVLAGASLYFRPGPDFVAEISGRIAQAGVDAPRVNSVTILLYSLPQEIVHTTEVPLIYRALCFGAFAVCFAASIILLRLLTEDNPIGLPPSFVLWCLAMASILSLIGIDYGRWFALAFISSVAAGVALNPKPELSWRVLRRDERLYPRLLVIFVVLVLLSAVLGQHFPVYPRWD